MAYIDIVFNKVRGHTDLLCKKWFSLISIRTFCHRAITFHMLIGLGEDMTPIAFSITRLTVNVTGVTCEKCKHGFRLFL